jgi:hypothetical protein
VTSDESITTADEVEILANCSCRANIDIKPDNSTPIDTVKWASIAFAPPKNTCSRYKAAYYKAKRIVKRTNVTFFAAARCSPCGDCSGTAMAEISLIYDND